MFLVLLAQFSQIISVNQHFLSSFTPTRISKVHAGWRLKQTRNFKDFLHTFYKSCFFRFWRDTDLENNFLEVRSSLCLHHPVIENCLFQCAVKQPVKLTSWTIFFAPHHTKRIQSSADRKSSLMTSSLTFAPFVSVLLCFSAHSRSRLVASPTSSQIYKHILALKEFSQTTCIFRFRKKAFQFELLFYCLLFANLLLWILTCLTWAQPSHTHKNWTNHEMCTA